MRSEISQVNRMSNNNNNTEIEKIDKELLKLDLKFNRLTTEINQIMNKYHNIALHEADKQVKSKAKVNDKIFKLRKAKQKLCKHETVVWSDISNTFREKKCTKCYKVLEYKNLDGERLE